MANRGDAWQILVLAVGVALVCYGAVPTVRLHRWRANALSARGRVIDHESGPGGHRRIVWWPVIQFEADGTTVRLRGQDARTPRRWPLGQPVDVLYDRADPRRARPAGAGLVLSWALIVGIAIVGAFIAIVSL
jgi:hypothetical protein